MIQLPVKKDLLPLQIITDFQQLRAVLCQLRRVVHDFFSHALCVRHHVGHAYVLLHHSLAQRLHVGLNVRVLYVAVIPPDGIQPQPLHVPQHYGRLLADTHFAPQVLHSLFQCAVAAGQYCALPLQIAHLLLNVRCASQLKLPVDILSIGGYTGIRRFWRGYFRMRFRREGSFADYLLFFYIKKVVQIRFPICIIAD